KSGIVKFSCIVGIGITLLFATSILLDRYGPNSVISVSPDNNHHVSYNRNTNVITVFHLQFDRASYVALGSEPTILWSSDNHYLALSFTQTDGEIQNQIYDVQFFGYKHDFRYVHSLLKDMFDVEKVHCKIKEFIDDESVLVEFFAEDESGKEVAGWFIYYLENGSVRDITLIN
ncbi:MAG: hypothetical protein FWF98_02040, partial [Dehalococcoidia bacterium]|nr:hypothetical protein [Dehalococcoidia bacterium]